MNDLEQFKQSLRQIIKDQAFAGTPEVFRKIEESDFFYEKSTLVELRNQGIQPLARLAPDEFKTSVGLFIDSLREVTSTSERIAFKKDNEAKTSQAVTQNSEEKELYKYYLTYPTAFEAKLVNRFRGRGNKENAHIFWVHGKSATLKTTIKGKGSLDGKFLWFIEHLLPDYFDLAKTKHTLVESADTKIVSNEFLLLEHIAKHLEITKYRDITKDNQDSAIQDLKHAIADKLSDGYLVVPIFLRFQTSLKSIKAFFEHFLKPLIEEAKQLQTHHALIFLLIWSEETGANDAIFHIENYSEEIEMKEVEDKTLKDWVYYPRNNFFTDNSLCDGFVCKCDTNLNQIVPECKTLEKLFENITQLIFPDVDFHQFLKNNVQNQLTK